MPTPPLQPEMIALANLIGGIIAKYIDKELPLNETPMEFRISNILDISIPEYLKRFAGYLNMTRSELLLIVIYFDRFFIKHPDYVLTETNIYLFLTAIVVETQKYIRDFDALSTMQTYCQIGGIPDPKSLLQAEVRLLSMLDFDLYVSKETYRHYNVNPVGRLREKLAHKTAETVVKRVLQDIEPNSEITKRPKLDSCLPLLAVTPAVLVAPTVTTQRFRFMSDVVGNVDLPWETEKTAEFKTP